MQTPKKWLCLAPVAIDPEWQGQRQGRRMIGMLSEWARLSRSCVVGIGPSLFYEKAGFVLLDEPGLRVDQGKDTISLAGPVDFAREQVLVYPKAISDLQTLA
jgi:putative acetyltransferase